MDASKAYEEIKNRRRSRLADSKIVERVLEIAPCTKSEVLRAFPNRGTAEQIDEVLAAMVNDGQIVLSKHSTGGRPAVIITLAPLTSPP